MLNLGIKKSKFKESINFKRDYIHKRNFKKNYKKESKKRQKNKKLKKNKIKK